MKVRDMQPANTTSAIKAFFKVETSEGIVIEGFKIVNGKNGLFVSSPSKKVNDKFFDTVTMARPLKDELTQMAMEEFNKLGQGGGAEDTGGYQEPAGPKDEMPF